MRLFVVATLFVLGVTAHAQQGANTEPADPATLARVRVDGAAGGTGAKVPPEAGGGTVGGGSQHRHSAPKPPDTQQAPVERSSRRDEAQSARRDNASAQPNTQATAPDDPATLARVRVDGAAGGTGAKVPPEASGGDTVGQGHQNRH